jgi:hypothetical protein
VGRVVIEDEIRGGREPVEVHEDHSVGQTIDRLVERAGLPRRSLDKRRLTYDLARPADEDDRRPFGLDQRIGDLRLVDGEVLVLSSPDASPVWAEINGLVGQVEDELRVQAGAWRDEITDEVRADISGRLTHLRGELDREARGRLQGLTSRLPWRRRLRARRLMRQVAATGAVPDDVAGVQVGLSQLTAAVSQAWRVTPFVIGGVVAGAGAVAVEAIDEDATSEEIAQELADDLGDDLADDVSDRLAAEIAARLGLPTADEVEEIVRAQVDLESRLTAERVEQIIDDAVASRGAGADLVEIIRREVPGAEQDGVASTALGGVTRSSPVRALDPGETLWSVALDVRGDPGAIGCDAGPPAETVGAYVRRIWAANAGVLGGDPDRIDPVAEIRVPCPE